MFTVSRKGLTVVSLLLGASLSSAAYAATQTICGQYDVVNIKPTSKIYTVHNNLWNDVSNSHCLSIDNATGNFSVLNALHYKPTNTAPAAYSFIGKGCHWGNCTNKSGMPIQANAILNARTSWKTTQTSTGVYNVSYDLWFNKTSSTTGQVNGAELMVWLTYKGAIQPIGQKIVSGANLDGTAWDIWFGLNGTLPVISYIRKTQTTAVNNLNLKALIDDAVARNKITAAWYLTGVEAGFEIWQGGTGLKSTDYSLLVE